MAFPGGGRFARLWAGSTASALGSGLVLVAAPLYVAAHTSNPLVVSATTGVAWLPWLAVALLAGWAGIALLDGALFVVNAGTYAVSAVLVGLVAGTYRASSRVSAAAERRSVRAELAFGVHGALWSIVGSSLRQRLTPPELLGRVGSTNLFIVAGGNCLGAMLGGAVAARFGITAPFWAGFVVAAVVAAATWRVFDRATVAQAYAEPAEPVPYTWTNG